MEKPRTKILYIITKSVWGGAQKYVYDLATHLPSKDFDVAVAAGGDGLLAARLRAHGIPVFPIPTLRRDVHIAKEIVAFFYLLKIIFREKPDIVHLNSSKIGVLGAIAAKFSALGIGHLVPVVFTVHGWGFKEDRSRMARAAIFLAEFVGSLFQDYIIVINSRDFASAKKFISRRKIEYIPNGIEPLSFLPRSNARIFFEKILKRKHRNGWSLYC